VKFDRRALGEEALSQAMSIRHRSGVDFEQPLCVYDLCERLGIIVRFNNINMEGMYDRLPKPRIHLSALRPLGRRAFNCAHELGHHLFGHGSTIDELRNSVEPKYTDPNEYVADVFAGQLLMPTLGVGGAFAKRGWDPATATRSQIYTIACHFGVGYATMVNHLVYGLCEIASTRLSELDKPVERVRRELLGYQESSPLIVADDFWASPTMDLEVGTVLMLPEGSKVTGDVVLVETDILGRRLFRGIRQGTGRIEGRNKAWSATLRVSRSQYVGLAKYRHMDDEDDAEYDESPVAD
jgi:Zn-dependent peptidase ImmA (M78 family)